MNQHGTQLRRPSVGTNRAQAAHMMEQAFANGSRNLTATQNETLTTHMPSPTAPDESCLNDAGRVPTAQTWAAEMVRADMPRPVDQDEWEHRFEVWQGGHPIRVLLREFHQTMDEIGDRALKTTEDTRVQTLDSASAKAWLRTDLTAEGVPPGLIERCMTPVAVPGKHVTIWHTPAAMDQEIEALIRPQWEALPLKVREDAWDAPSDGADYYHSTMRVGAGLSSY